MCGRFSLTVNEAELNLRFETEGGVAPYESRYNCAPTQMLTVIANNEPSRLQKFKWGLIPSWTKDAAIGNKMINARAETITEKPSYRKPLRSQRCLVPADAFYEWKLNGKKIPHRIFVKDQKIFSMAGLWDLWVSSDGELIHSFTIITTGANEFMKNIHDRMPVILRPEEEKIWLQENNESKLLSLLRSYPSELMDSYPISSLANSVSNEGPLVIEKMDEH